MPVKMELDTIGMLLTDVSRLLRGAFDRRVTASGIGVTPGEARALIQVAATEGIKQADIAVRMGIEPMTLSAYLDRLEAMGMVERCPDPGDRRAKNVVATEKSDPVLAVLRKEVRGLMDEVTDGVDPAGREALRASLKILRENLHQLDRTGTEAKEPAQ